MEKIVIITLQNTEKVSKRKTAQVKTCLLFTSQTNPIHETEIANSRQPVVRVCKVTVTKN